MRWRASRASDLGVIPGVRAPPLPRPAPAFALAGARRAGVLRAEVDRARLLVDTARLGLGASASSSSLASPGVAAAGEGEGASALGGCPAGLLAPRMTNLSMRPNQGQPQHNCQPLRCPLLCRHLLESGLPQWRRPGNPIKSSGESGRATDVSWRGLPRHRRGDARPQVPRQRASRVRGSELLRPSKPCRESATG